MRNRTLTLLLTTALLSCSPERPTNDSGKTLLDERITLARGRQSDSASRVLRAPTGAVVVAFVDELGCDVSLRLRAGEKLVAVETNQQGEGLEIAVLAMPASGQMTLELEGPPDGDEPGRVSLKVIWFSKAQVSNATVAARLAAYAAWSGATRTGLRADDVRGDALPKIDRAISNFESAVDGDARLAAFAHLVRAWLLYYYEIDWREARTESRLAAAAFTAADVADAISAARARRLEASALQEIALDQTASNPTAAEADAEARKIYGELTDSSSALDSVGQARVHNSMGLMDLNRQAWASAQEHFQSTLIEYRRAHYRAGVNQTLRNLALLSNYRGDYRAAAKTYETLVAEISSLSDPEARMTLLINSGTANSNAGNTDRAIDLFSRAQ